MSNSFFRTSDPHVTAIGGMELLPSWWSRPWEYAWAIKYAQLDAVVADMGAGWSGRPFKEALAEVCKHVYAVDLDPRLKELPRPDNCTFVIADFTKRVNIPMVDTIFCISVLEDLIHYGDALREFKRLLKPGGEIVITCDMRYDFSKPLPKYPGVHLAHLTNAVAASGLAFDGAVELDRSGDLVHHDEWNLCCFHCVLIHA